MPRFFVDTEAVSGGRIRLTGRDAKHIAVLRHKPGDEITVSDGANEYLCRISSVKKDEIISDIIRKTTPAAEPRVAITLFQALPKADKMELIIQKAVELGVFEIVPVTTARSVAGSGAGKLERWQKISEAAAKQCGRGIVPRVCPAVGFEAALGMLNELDEGYAAYECETETTVRSAFADSHGDRVGIFIGPEGGFADDEAAVMKERGIRTFSLGKRILRTETAGFAAVICLMLFREEL